MKKISKIKNGVIKAVKLEKEVNKVRIKGSTSDVCEKNIHLLLLITNHYYYSILFTSSSPLVYDP